MTQPRPQGAFPWLWRWDGKSVAPPPKQGKSALGTRLPMTQSEQGRTFYFRGKTKMYLNINRFVKAPPPLLLPALTGIGVAKDFARSRLCQGLLYKLVTYFHDFHVDNILVMCYVNWNNLFEKPARTINPATKL